MLELLVLPLQILAALTVAGIVKGYLQRRKWKVLEQEWESQDWDSEF
jgi:hypothetical protein